MILSYRWYVKNALTSPKYFFFITHAWHSRSHYFISRWYFSLFLGSASYLVSFSSSLFLYIHRVAVVCINIFIYILHKRKLISCGVVSHSLIHSLTYLPHRLSKNSWYSFQKYLYFFTMYTYAHTFFSVELIYS